jgi:hypothetical protein
LKDLARAGEQKAQRIILAECQLDLILALKPGLKNEKRNSA